ncbi:unnamed protein product [Strongylus vulgaris]|uniref:Uncharacterized protein n=1 Tax=Strongylus vulgaris TaxID=40348 RepID=A0A3P7K501_STRVU|nr:unnamed protein product [Strongylus vulgaris]
MAVKIVAVIVRNLRKAETKILENGHGSIDLLTDKDNYSSLVGK